MYAGVSSPRRLRLDANFTKVHELEYRIDIKSYREIKFSSKSFSKGLEKFPYLNTHLNAPQTALQSLIIKYSSIEHISYSTIEKITLVDLNIHH